MPKRTVQRRPVSPTAMALDEGHDIQSPNDVHCNLEISDHRRIPTGSHRGPANHRSKMARFPLGLDDLYKSEVRPWPFKILQIRCQRRFRSTSVNSSGRNPSMIPILYNNSSLFRVRSFSLVVVSWGPGVEYIRNRPQ